LYQDFPIGTGSVQGDLGSDFKENRSYYNVFLEARYSIFAKTNVVVGLNYNQTSYSLEDRFPFSNNDPDQSGSFRFDGILSPQLGVTHSLSKYTSMYANMSRGFSPLSLQETLLPNGQINTDLEPETGWNYEIGIRGNAANGRLQWNAALYRIDLRNLLVSRRTAVDQFIGVNAGKTQHDGLELQLSYDWVRTATVQLNSFLNYSLNDFVFKEFVDEDNDFSGNQLTGVPDQVLNMGIDFNSEFGIFGNVNFQHVGSQPITDSNSLFSDGYQLTNVKIGYQQNIAASIRLQLFFGINNVFNEKYASQILINASSFGGSTPRYFYPGNPTNYFGGLNINYSF
jgi:iron complex outermembrane receptor protein